MADNQVAPPAQEAAQQPATDNTTNLMSPGGDLVSVSNDQLPAALHPVNGYRLATPQDVTDYQNEQKYGGLGQTLQAAGEGALSTATFGTVPGIGSSEDILGRQQQHPIASGIGSSLPFAIPGVGEAEEAGLLGKAAQAVTTVPRAIANAGEAITEATGLTGTGAKALQYAAEGAIINGSNIVSKMLLNDPDLSVSNALMSEGTAALIGGALGAAAGGIGRTAEMWQSKYGAKATDAIIDHTIPDIAHQELQSGIEVPASMRDALSGDQDAYDKVQTLQKSDSYAGKQMQSDVDNLYGQAQDKTLETLGANPSLVEKAPNAYEAGTQIKDALKEGIDAGKQLYGPVYDELRNQYKGIPVTADQKAVFAGKLTQALSESGVGALEGSSEKSTMNNLFKSLDNISTAEGVKNLNTGLNNAARNPELQRLAAVAGPVIKDFESSVVQSHLGETDPTGALLGQRKAADDAYKVAMGTMNDIKQSVGLGRFKGTNGFLRALDEKPPEQILQRLSNKNRQDMIEMLQQKFPKAAEVLKNYHINDQLNDAKLPGGGLNTKKFLNNLLDGATNPEHIQNLITGGPEATARLASIKNILNAIPKDGNPSNSAAMLDKLWKGKIGTIVGGVFGLGGGHLTGGILGGVGEHVLGEIKPFLSYKMLEMRGGGKNIVPGQVKALFDYAKSVGEGHLLVSKAVNNVFNTNNVIPGSKVPSEADRKKLDKYISEVNKNPAVLQNTAKDLQDILPDHSPALGLVASKAAAYLNALKPRPQLGLPQDTKVKPTSAETQDYNRQLDIAQQPLMVLQHIKDGSITPRDIATLQAVHPAAYQQLQQKLMGQLEDPDLKIPYKTRLSMSAFVGQPLDSTMTPQGILGAQPVPPQAPQSGPQSSPPRNKRNTSSLTKFSKPYQTQSQAAESDRSSRD